jgi:acyl-coenzyme A thioesterase PaaI-like protein
VSVKWKPVKLDDVLPSSYRECFGCGSDNDAGIKLKDLRLDDDGVTRATLRPASHHAGFPGVLHGGVSMAALDEVMGYACRFISGDWYATAKIDFKFRRPVPPSGALAVEAGVTSGTRRLQTWGKLLLSDGSVAIEATGLFLPAPGIMSEPLT